MATQQAANALIISLSGGTPSLTGGIYTYNYNVELESGDSIDIFDTLDFTGLFGVTNATASSPYSLSVVGFDSVSASFDVISPQSGPTTLSNVITLESTAGAGLVDYSAFFSNRRTPNFTTGQVLGPSATPVPENFPSGLGLLLAAGFGFQRYRQRAKTSN